MNSSAGIAAPQQVEQGINASKGSGSSLSPGLQQEMGNKMNADFSNVKIHTDESAAEMNKEVSAKAFTHGNDIYFNSGQYKPSSNEGKHLLAHELTHTLQQGNVNRMIQRQAVTKPKSQSRVVKLAYAELKKEKVDKKRLLELCGEFSEEDIHDHFEGIMTTMKDKVDSRTYIDAYIIFQDNYWFKNKDETRARTRWQKSNMAAVDDVKSVTIENVYDKTLPDLFKTVKTKMAARDNLLQSVTGWKEVTGNAAVNTAIQSSIKRWADLKVILNNPKFDTIKGTLPLTLDADIANEENNISQIPGSTAKDRLYYTKATMREFIKALRGYKSKKEERVVEEKQFHRFDDLFVQAKMYKILGVYNVFFPATIKALTARESGDFTYIEVAGVGKNKPGYQNPLQPKYPKTYTGIAQMGAPAKSEAISWASSNGIEIPAKVDETDSRDLPEYAILLSAAYLSNLYNQLKTEYGKRFPSDISEKRKIVFAVYNWNLGNFNAMVKKNFKSTDVLTYAGVKPHLPGETQTYVFEIYQRLG
ncbi:MAG: hypothetical protein JWP12_3231 [Bacteroidetes bacterium]|nr:hypothetical protein [Bacteroidota bacterium]